MHETVMAQDDYRLLIRRTLNPVADRKDSKSCGELGYEVGLNQRDRDLWVVKKSRRLAGMRFGGSMRWTD